MQYWGAKPRTAKGPCTVALPTSSSTGYQVSTEAGTGAAYRHSSQTSYCLCWKDAALRAWDCCSPRGRLAGVHIWVLQLSMQTCIALGMADLAPINSIKSALFPPQSRAHRLQVKPTQAAPPSRKTCRQGCRSRVNCQRLGTRGIA